MLATTTRSTLPMVVSAQGHALSFTMCDDSILIVLLKYTFMPVQSGVSESDFLLLKMYFEY